MRTVRQVGGGATPRAGTAPLPALSPCQEPRGMTPPGTLLQTTVGIGWPVAAHRRRTFLPSSTMMGRCGASSPEPVRRETVLDRFSRRQVGRQVDRQAGRQVGLPSCSPGMDGGMRNSLALAYWPFTLYRYTQMPGVPGWPGVPFVPDFPRGPGRPANRKNNTTRLSHHWQTVCDSACSDSPRTPGGPDAPGGPPRPGRPADQQQRS